MCRLNIALRHLYATQHEYIIEKNATNATMGKKKTKMKPKINEKKSS
jgi:hypothetical protein